jgi:hypothetical protein
MTTSSAVLDQIRGMANPRHCSQAWCARASISHVKIGNFRTDCKYYSQYVLHIIQQVVGRCPPVTLTVQNCTKISLLWSRTVQRTVRPPLSKA